MGVGVGGGGVGVGVGVGFAQSSQHCSHTSGYISHQMVPGRGHSQSASYGLTRPLGRRMSGGSDAYTKPAPIDRKANSVDIIDSLTKLVNYDQHSTATVTTDALDASALTALNRIERIGL